jgi:arsenate reductase
LQLDLAALSDDEIVANLAKAPGLLERPIVVHNGRACIGRPPENVLNLL